MVADGKTFEATLTVPHGLPRLADLWREVNAVQFTKTNTMLCTQDELRLKCLYDNYDIYTVNDLFIVTTITGDFMC